jgi:Ca2+-binding EF-hand superfamily protein
METKELDIVDRIFDSLDVDSKGKISANDIFEALNIRGILKDDLRIKDIVISLNSYKKGKEINAQEFRGLVGSNIALFEKALTGKMIIPDFKNFCSL